MDINIPLKKVLLPEAARKDVKPLMGFDYGDDIYHVIAFDFGDSGGALGILREGDNFCARISLDDLVTFNRQAKAMHIEGQG